MRMHSQQPRLTGNLDTSPTYGSIFSTEEEHRLTDLAEIQQHATAYDHVRCKFSIEDQPHGQSVAATITT
jgi:hypothetical protein